MSTKQTFTVDVEIYTTLTVEAESAADAERQIEEALEGHEANFGAWKNGDPIIADIAIYDDGITVRGDHEDEDED